jgi:hypothetical protein
MMNGYEPIRSFGEAVAEMYRDIQRGDESAAIAVLEQLAERGLVLELTASSARWVAAFSHARR